MQYNAETPDEYIKLLEDDWRKVKLLAIRKMIRNYAPELKEGIAYKMLIYGDEPYLFALNAQKNYVSLYVANIEKIDPRKEMLKPFDMGKGCIRVKKSVDISSTQLEAFINKTIELWRKGGDSAC